MNAKQRLRWEKTRTAGPIRFIMLYGVLGWGVLTGLLFSMIFPLYGPPNATFGKVAALAIPAFAAGGLVWGAIMWIASERAYQKHRVE
jgi:hypothetical protein